MHAEEATGLPATNMKECRGARHGTAGSSTLTVLNVLWDIWTVISRHLPQVVPHNPAAAAPTW